MQRRFASHTALAEATRREMEEEQQRQSKPAMPQVPTGWAVERKPGETVFTMRKTYEGEEILLRYGGTTVEDEAVAHNFTVFVTNKNKTLAFELSYEDGELVLDGIAFHDDTKFAFDESAEAEVRREKLYAGPDVSELEEGLVDAFISYLETRGVDDKLGEFVDAYSFWAEQADYEVWLSAINRFVS
ncbi:putative p22 protein precursor [Trypanosoma grayi]|uniref:putative p22 protein precursor n=1 Tax=Trypanosoma grayi TaxID=71804 RepID=UPI0004F4190B|nr:putative p22 protein precursor [Trypanosoma grayi]KEG13495.1 putative p22 protein precursor [Trypanosoma grayi]